MLLSFGRKPILVVSSVEMATEILKTHDLVFADRFTTKASKTFFFGGTDIAQSPYGEYWRQVKKLCVRELLNIKRVRSFKYIREEEVDKLMAKITCSSKKRETVDLTEILHTFSNNIIFRCTLGDKILKDYPDRFLVLSEKMSSLMMDAYALEDFVPWLKWMDTLTGFNGKLRRTFQELDTLINQIIDDHHISKSPIGSHSDQDNRDDKRNFIDLLLLHAGTANLNLSRNHVKGVIMDMLIGGSDTAVTVIEWTMSELIKNPKVMNKAQEEVRRIVGNKTKVDEEDINQMNYLKCVVKEGLRLHAPVPCLGPRNSTVSVKVKGYDIPQDAAVFINAWAIHRDPEFWEKTEEFIPERFENNHFDFKGQDFQFIPFGSGRRGCPGASFGIAVVEIVLANLLYGFDWKLPGGVNNEDLDMAEGAGALTCNRKIHLYVVPILSGSTSF
ncbi:hypothetical protein MKX03_010929 [Papaver bracteatum]|nr:hypothetical protein MKX03_010929 [Papaver bracteatum]